MKHCMIILLTTFLCALLLAGCWDYRGMDQINIVSGVAIDKGNNGGYKLTLELINIANMQDGSEASSLLTTAEGATIFEAVRNSKKKLYNKLYFGSLRTVIISKDLAREYGIRDIVDGFIRDVEPRETIFFVISQEDSAYKILHANGLDTANVSNDIAKIIEEDHKVDSTSKSIQMYQAFNMVKAKGLELVLPAFHIVKNEDEDVIEINGIATFRDDKLVSFLSPEETHYFLITTDKNTNGAMSLPDPQNEDELVSIEITKCTNKPEVRYDDGKVSIFVNIDFHFKIVEIPHKKITEDVIDHMKAQVETVVEQRVTDIFHKVQNNPGVDIYGYGNKLYENQYKLWTKIEDQWPELFREADFHVKVESDVTNIGILS